MRVKVKVSVSFLFDVCAVRSKLLATVDINGQRGRDHVVES